MYSGTIVVHDFHRFGKMRQLGFDDLLEVPHALQDRIKSSRDIPFHPSIPEDEAPVAFCATQINYDSQCR